MGWALQMKWLWWQRTSTDRAWSGLEIPCHPHARRMFAISMITNVGYGRNTLFWTDHWLHGCSLVDMALEVAACLQSRILKIRTAEETLDNRVWVQDIRGGLSLNGLIEFLKLWDALLNFTLTNDDDQHHWKHDISGSFSSKSAYKSWAPEKCKMFLWLAIKDKCWTADQLTKRGLPHPDKCLL
jgi:hypothetical protein